MKQSRIVSVALDCFIASLLTMTDANTVILRCWSEAEASRDERPRCQHPRPSPFEARRFATGTSG